MLVAKTSVVRQSNRSHSQTVARAEVASFDMMHHASAPRQQQRRRRNGSTWVARALPLAAMVSESLCAAVAAMEAADVRRLAFEAL